MKNHILAAIFLLAVLSPLLADDFDWPDRRPIGAVFLATSGKGWPKNPRGYFNDPELDVSTEGGRAELRRRMLDLADRTIARVKDVGAQGVVVWDIEGGEMPHAVTYLGDPRILPRVAPEMDGIADEFFAKFREAGIPTGVCIRPSTIVFKEEGNYPWIKGRYGHTDGPDPVGVLADKIAYAKKRWGCSNFYMDTNYTPKLENGELVRKIGGAVDFRRLSGAEMAELRKRHPDVLIWPEFQDPDYFASCSGYGEYREIGKFSAAAREQYPKAFRVWMPRLLPTDIYANWDDFITNGMMKGEVFLFECAPTMSPMGDVLKNATAEVSLRSAKNKFEPDPAKRIALLASETDWARRRVLIDSLAEDRSTSATEALRGVLRREQNGLQWFAAVSLGRQGTPEALEVLEKSLDSKSEDERLAAIRGLGASGKTEMAAILQPLLKSHGDPATRWATLDALAALRSPASVEPLIEFQKGLKGTSATRSREKVVRALGEIGGPVAVETLQTALKDPEYSGLRPIMVASLKKLGVTPK